MLQRKYSRKLLSEILDIMAKGHGTVLIQTLKIINTKDVIYIAAKLYDKIPSSTLTKSWSSCMGSVSRCSTICQAKQEASKEDNPKARDSNLHTPEPDRNQSILKD